MLCFTATENAKAQSEKDRRLGEHFVVCAPFRKQINIQRERENALGCRECALQTFSYANVCYLRSSSSTTTVVCGLSVLGDMMVVMVVVAIQLLVDTSGATTKKKRQRAHNQKVEGARKLSLAFLSRRELLL